MPKRRWSFFMPAQDHHFIKRILVFFHIFLTDTGRILFCILFIATSIASPGTHISAYYLPCFLFALLSTVLILSTFFKPHVSIKRLLCRAPNAGDFFVYKVKIKNTGKRPLYNVSVFEGVLPYGLYNAPYHEDYDNTLDCLAPGEERTVTLVIKCRYRGIYQLPGMIAGCSYPSNLTRWPVRAGAPQKFVVYPKFVSQSGFYIPYHRVYQPGGIAVSSNVGNSTEFLNTREFRHGDRLRDIHWPSYARTGKLIVKEYVDEYFVRTGLFLDTELRFRDRQEAFERRISVAAGIADAIARKEYIIDLFAAGEHLHHFQMGRALAHLDNLLELLACLEGVKKLNFKKLHSAINPYLRSLSSLIIILKDWDDERAEFCNALNRLGLSQKIVVISDRPLSHPADRDLVVIPAKGKERLIQ